MKKILGSDDEGFNDETQIKYDKCKPIAWPIADQDNWGTDLYIGSVMCWGRCPLTMQVQEKEKLLWRWGDNDCFHLFNKQSECIVVYAILSPFFRELACERSNNVGRLLFYAQIPDTSPEDKKQLKKSLGKKSNRLRKICRIRIDAFLNPGAFIENNRAYSIKMQGLKHIQQRLRQTEKLSPEHWEIKRELQAATDDIYSQKINRGLMLYFIEKSKVKVLNRSFVKPSPRMNYLFREYRRITIGLIASNERHRYAWMKKVDRWKLKYLRMGTYYPCIKDESLTNYYQSFDDQKSIVWGYPTSFINERERFENMRMNLQSEVESEKQIRVANRKKLFAEIGAFGFEENEDESASEDENDNTNQSALQKKNQILMEKFEKENKLFREHPDPPSLISQLKPYQRQALQWMKYREGKIAVDELFQKQFIKGQEDLDYERKLSPFWEEVELASGDKFFVNYLTGEFTQQFHEWKSIRGGILADEMGLGKTVMTLSLLADQNFEGLNLIVVPVAVLMQWKQEIWKHCGPDIKVYEYHSKAHNRRSVNLKEYQIVLITYSTLGHEYKHFTQNRNPDAKYLFEYEFQRVVLDEAHNIRGTKTLQFSAVLNLKSLYSWCLTGTLIQNSEQDLFGIFKFLKVEVFSEEYWWNQYIKNSGCSQAKLNVIQTVLRPIVLRRTKASTSQGGQKIIELTNKFQTTVRPIFSQIQSKIYSKLQSGVRAFFKQNAESGRNYTHVFQIIAKLRQFCCHPALIFRTDAEELAEGDIEATLKSFLSVKVVSEAYQETAMSNLLENGSVCLICTEEPAEEQALMTQCGHFFCEPCLQKHLKKNKTCPLCRRQISEKGYIKKSQITGPSVAKELKDVKQSSKLTAVLKVMEQVRERNEKCVVFTQWIPFISLLEEQLLQRGVQFATIQGSMPIFKRQRAINRFRQKSSCQFLLVSIRAGGTGLNLAFANNVLICDPWWNPSQEEQAIGRAHRLGQQKDVNVYRFIMQDSIEQKIEKMHESKRKMAEQVMMQKGSLPDSKSKTEQLIRLLE